MSRWPVRLVWLCIFVRVGLLLVASGLAAVPPATENSVLVLYGERGDLPAIEAVEENMRIRGVRGMVRKGEEARSSMNLNSVIADVVPFIHSEALERHCTVATELDPGLPLVTANPVLLQQVLLNLIINAFDAMRETPAANRRVIIRTECESGGGARVTVRDFGTDLLAENLERIFEHFYSTKPDGLGLGLAITRSIIASHGGELAAVNAEGGGTSVHFSPPAAKKGGV